MPDVQGPSEDQEFRFPQGEDSPFQSQRIDILNHDSPRPQDKKTRQWIRARGKISEKGGQQAHLSALAYMSDSYFIGTVSRVHRLWRFSSMTSKDGKERNSIDEAVLEKLRNADENTLKRMAGMDEDIIEQLKSIKGPFENAQKRPEIGMMVSLDHTIYFHAPMDIKADEWMFTEMESPWAGDGRGLVFQRMFTREGKLVATCVQEGVVRLKQQPESKL
ncbi:acyl-CoA thioesterase [Taxawa tesnikishii (nom. ined.)]|nr:acyl-CoA thioesterase [Dothideales sp. JES 119]